MTSGDVTKIFWKNHNLLMSLRVRGSVVIKIILTPPT